MPSVPTTSLAIFALAAVCSAQTPAWADVAIPAGVNPTAVTSLGKLVVYADAGALHVYSAFTRSWHTTTVATTPTLRVTNDCLLAQDGGTWIAFSSYRGRFEPLAVSAGAQLLNAGASNNDSILLVADSGQLHAFSGFVGTWSTRPVSSAFAASVQRHTALLADGNVLAGMDAFTGQWHDVAVAAPPTSLSTDGTVGIALGAGTVHAFSAVHRAWRTAAALPNATFTRSDDWALFRDGSRMLAFSGPRGTFAAAPFGGTGVRATEDLFTLLDTAAGIVAFSAITGTFSEALAPVTATVQSNGAVAVLVDGGRVLGYGAPPNRAAALRLAAGATGTASAVAFVRDAGGGTPWLFSALTGQWHASPGDVLPADPLLTTTSALVATTNGLRAFSARSGRFVPLVGQGLAMSGNGSSAPALAYDAATLFAFDARLDRWVSTPRAAQGTISPQIWRTTAVVVDGTTAFGFGAANGTWSSTTLSGAATSIRANSESGRIATAGHVYGYSSLPELAALAQFPEFRRVQTTGADLRLALPLAQQAIALLGASRLAAVPVTVPGVGELLLDPAGLVTLPLAPTATGDPVDVVIPVPASPALVGHDQAFQAVVLSSSSGPHLTEACTVLLL